MISEKKKKEVDSEGDGETNDNDDDDDDKLSEINSEATEDLWSDLDQIADKHPSIIQKKRKNKTPGGVVTKDVKNNFKMIKKLKSSK